MNYNEMIVDYIDNCPFDEPIFFEEIKEYFQGIIDSHTINVYLNRLVHDNKIVQYQKGVYYKPIKGLFGDKKLNGNKVIEKKYIKDNQGYKGYYAGAVLFNRLGLTTQVPRTSLIITNECSYKNDYYNKNLGVIIRKPKIEITDKNYKYLQLIDILLNQDHINIEVVNEKDIIRQFISDNQLEIAELFKYAELTKSKKAIDKLHDL
ncbi:MAG: hypothetical protein LUG12_08185 [Erysipelotrichaceae bacterium]|nr:hypothetical protein [Erysipelotrichaceae bacterium]